MKKFIILFVLFLFGIVSYAQQATSAKQQTQINNQRTQIYQNSTDSTRIAAIKVSIDSLLRYNRSALGLNGTVTITGTDSTATARGYCVKALTTTVINKMWYKTGTGKTSISTYTLATDACFYGDILSVDLTSGSVIVYLY